jgi:hypothetical protein
MEELDETTPAVGGGKEVMNGVMINGVEVKTSGFPESVAVEEDVWHRPWFGTVWTGGVIAGSGAE